MDRKEIGKVIKIYLEELSKKIKVERAILFGSSLHDKIDKNQDIDLLILSSAFAKMNSAQRLDLLYTTRKNLLTQKTPMDIFGLTPEEYAKASPLSIVGEIKETGKEIYNKTIQR